MTYDTYRNERTAPGGCLVEALAACECYETEPSPCNWTTRIYAAALEVEEMTVDRDDSGYQAVDSLLGEMLARDTAALSELLQLPPDDERSDEDIAEAIIGLIREVGRGHAIEQKAREWIHPDATLEERRVAHSILAAGAAHEFLAMQDKDAAS